MNILYVVLLFYYIYKGIVLLITLEYVKVYSNITSGISMTSMFEHMISKTSLLIPPRVQHSNIPGTHYEILFIV